MPTPKEFERLVDLSKTSPPTIKTPYFPNTSNGLYWTGTTCSGCHRRKAIAEDFDTGNLYYGNKYYEEVYYENYVRCVTNAKPTVVDAIVIYCKPQNKQSSSPVVNRIRNRQRWLQPLPLRNAENGESIKINTSLIPAKGSSTQGATYEFINTYVKNRKTYYYKLEDIDLKGTATMHGPVRATPMLIFGVGK